VAGGGRGWMPIATRRVAMEFGTLRSGLVSSDTRNSTPQVPVGVVAGVATDGEDVAVVEQTVEDRGGDHRVAEHSTPSAASKPADPIRVPSMFDSLEVKVLFPF
jgi:hypothetical protein